MVIEKTLQKRLFPSKSWFGIGLWLSLLRFLSHRFHPRRYIQIELIFIVCLKNGTSRFVTHLEVYFMHVYVYVYVYVKYCKCH